MTAEEIFAGESDNVEFKEEIPVKSERYMKTVVAFANGRGGKLIFGVENNTWKVTGFSKEEVFQKMDAITNAIFDSCEPKIIPSIGVQEVDGKSIIEVEIMSGMTRPYLYQEPRSFGWDVCPGERYDTSCRTLSGAGADSGRPEPLL